MTCGHVCGFCDRKVKVTSATVEGSSPNDTLQLQIPNMNLRQNDRLGLIMATNLPSEANAQPVTVKVGNSDPIPVQTKTGNVLRADQISCRRVYRVVYGDDPEHLTMVHYLRESQGSNE